MSTKHTAGPWFAAPQGSNPLPGETLGIVYAGGPSGWTFLLGKKGAGAPASEWNANARLIAAAPELLEACKAAIPFLTDHIALTLGYGPRDRIVLDMVEAAIQKAEGTV